MSEIEKMYRNAHIYPKVYGDITKETFENKAFNMADMCNEAFTAEKQIGLIKWLIVHSPSTCLEDEIIVSAFEDSLANIINTLWQDLNEQERTEVKEILQ